MSGNFVDADFQQAVQQLSWWDLYSCEDPDKAVNILTSKLTTLLDQMAPIRTIQVRSKYAPWLSDSTKQLLSRRNEAQKIASQTKDIDDYRQYKALRNQATSVMRQEKRAWEKQKLSSTRQDPARLWKNVKTWLSWNNSGPPNKLFNNGRLVSSPAGIAGTMNSFFVG